jgi:putative membrane protein
MEHMFETGFLGTRAPLFMDFVTVIVILLPFLIGGSIYLAKRQSYKFHQISQIVILITSVIVVGYFEYGVRLGGGFAEYVKATAVSYNIALAILIVHILIAVITLYLWIGTIMMAKRYQIIDSPHPYYNHKKAGIRVAVGIIATSLTGLIVYVVLFVL